jgi:hypothetical protein
MTTVTRSIRFTTKDRRKRAVVATSRDSNPLPPESPGGKAIATDANDGRVPRVARLMALAIRFDQLLHNGVVANQTELARLARVTQPRMTQIMNLLHLAPDLQEALLFLHSSRPGRDPLTERDLRALTCMSLWDEQRSRWRKLARVRRDDDNGAKPG